ncbi:MAG TPA: type II secretion system inner membrane protein GspF [Pseudomonadales bacterium]
MPAFEYSALNEKGREKKGVLEGDSPRQIRQKLREKNWVPLTVELTKQKEKSISSIRIFSGGAKISAKDLSLITRQLATLIQAGLAVEEAVGAVARQTEKQKVKSMLLAIRSRVLEGHSFAIALAEYPRSFPELYRATVAAGEESGHLDKVLEQLADFTERRHATQQKVQQALLYPVILLIFAILIVAGMLGFIVPKLVMAFENSGGTLPLLTQWLIAASEFTKAWGVYIFILAILSVFAFRYSLKLEKNRFRFHRFVMKVPLYNKIVIGGDTSRFASTLSILASSGVPLVEALKIAAQVMANLCIKEAVRDVTTKMREGSSLNRALEPCGYFSPMMIQMIASGEASGELETMLDRVALSQERDLESLVSTIVSLFEPLILVIMGVMVLLMVLAIMLPIVSMNDLVS